MGRTRQAMAGGQTKKRATRLQAIEARLEVLTKAQVQQGSSLSSFGGAYNNLLAKLVRKGVLTEEDLKRSLDEVDPDTTESEEKQESDEKPEPGWWARLWNSKSEENRNGVYRG